MSCLVYQHAEKFFENNAHTESAEQAQANYARTKSLFHKNLLFAKERIHAKLPRKRGDNGEGVARVNLFLL